MASTNDTSSNPTSTPSDLSSPAPSSTPASSPSTSPSPSSSPTSSAASTTPFSTPSSSAPSSSPPSTSSPSSTPTTTRPSSTPSSTVPSTSSTPSTTSTPTTSTFPSTATTTTVPPSSTPQSTSTLTSTAIRSDSSSLSSSSTSSSASSTGTPGLVTGGKSASSGGLGTGGTIAVAVVVPIVAVALLVLAGLFLWRKRKARKDAEELRRKEVEEYGYNPNNDPTLPAVGSAGQDGAYEMQEDGSSGYRGWGTTAVGSTGRKASTTLSGGGLGNAYSEGTSPTYGPVSDTRSENLLVDGHASGEQEALGAMGPAANNNRSGDINRGPSNASSSYSAANRSDGSGEGVGGAYFNNQYDAGNPYTETPYGSPPGRTEMSGQPIIRDVQARRNTRIENPSHFPQQSAGISQNF